MTGYGHLPDLLNMSKSWKVNNMDIVTPEQRSRNMAAIRSQNTKPEVYFRKLLFAQGYRYSLNSKNIPGHPDMYLRKYNTAIFVHGCFWHRHEGCKYAYMPKSKIEFWENKFEMNKKRDIVVRRSLLEKGIRYIVIWECTIRKMKKDNEFCKNILIQVNKFLKSEETLIEF